MYVYYSIYGCVCACVYGVMSDIQRRVKSFSVHRSYITLTGQDKMQKRDLGAERVVGEVEFREFLKVWL